MDANAESMVLLMEKVRSLSELVPWWRRRKMRRLTDRISELSKEIMVIVGVPEDNENKEQ